MQDILNPRATEFLRQLEREFGSRRNELLRERSERQHRLDSGELPNFLPETRGVRESTWTVAHAPRDLDERVVEITGPAERKMMINALNSGASVFMADLEDSLSPTWENVIEGQRNLAAAVRRTLKHRQSEERTYELKRGEKLATLVVRPRGWHLEERHFEVDGAPMSASLFDFGLYFFHNAEELLRRDSRPYFYLPKLESHREARLWNDVFVWAQDRLGLTRGTIRATVLIENILAAFEMDEILYELREHAAGLNAGRWDYLFSILKKFRTRDIEFPDRSQLTMEIPFMRTYAELLIRTCHRRNAHAIGGMAAFIPNRRDPDLNRTALEKVRTDKEREAKEGFDGTWVAHPDLVSVARQVFGSVLAGKRHQKQTLPPARTEGDLQSALLDFAVPEGRLTSTGLENNVRISLQYLDRWLDGVGAAAIQNLMEDAATAEIARAQLWHWIKRGALLEDGRRVTSGEYLQHREKELTRLRSLGATHVERAAALLDQLVLNDSFEEFLTLPAYQEVCSQ